MKINGKYVSGGLIEGTTFPKDNNPEITAPARVFKKIMREDFHGGLMPRTPEAINKLIKESGVDTNLISDGFYTFGELYEHRIVLFIALCRITTRLSYEQYGTVERAWRSKTHSDGSVWDGWFTLGIGKDKGEQITYHLPISKWDDCNFATTLDKAPEYDGHTSADVLERLKEL